MNKLTKNKIFFNLEKIIASTTALGIIILTIILIQSCTTTSHTMIPSKSYHDMGYKRLVHKQQTSCTKF